MIVAGLWGFGYGERVGFDGEMGLKVSFVDVLDSFEILRW